MKSLLNSRVVVTIIIVIILLFAGQWAYNKYMNLQTDLRIAQQNEASLKDSLRVTTNKLGQIEVSKQILVAKNERDLRKLNSDMADKLSKLSGKISSLTSTVIQLSGVIEDMQNIDTDVVDVSPPDSSGTSIKAFTWRYEKTFDEDNFRSIAGKTTFSVDSTNSIFKPLRTSITEDEIRFQLTQGLRTTDDGKVEMFATSNYPNFAVKELNSVLIDPDSHPALKQFTKRKRFSLGLYGGFGGTVNLSNSTIIFGPQFGVGGSWRLW